MTQVFALTLQALQAIGAMLFGKNDIDELRWREAARINGYAPWTRF